MFVVWVAFKPEQQTQALFTDRTGGKTIMKAVVLAGGKGTRLLPYTRIFPKPLIPIGEMPILEVLIHQMRCAGIDEIVLTVGHLSELIRAFFQDGSQFGVPIAYSYEETPLGTAGPLAMVVGLEDTFMVTNGDVLTTLPMAQLIANHKHSGAVATIAMHRREVKVDLGVIQLQGGRRREDFLQAAPLLVDDGQQIHQVVDYIEKPSYHYLVSMGLYIFEPRVLAYIPSNQYLDFPDLIKKLLAAGEMVNGFPFTGYWQDLGRPDDYEQACSDFEAMRDEFLPRDCTSPKNNHGYHKEP
jgi:NDP-mannose synthase